MSSDCTLYLLPCDVFVSPITATVPRDNIMPTPTGLTHIVMDEWNVTVERMEYGTYMAEVNLALSSEYAASGLLDWFFAASASHQGVLRDVAHQLRLILKTVRAHGGEDTDYIARLLRFRLLVTEARKALQEVEDRAMGL